MKKRKDAGSKSAETPPSRKAKTAVAPKEAFAFTRLHLRIALLLILAIAAGMRFYALPTTPPGLFVDEAMDGANALEALETGHFSVFYPEDNGREGLYVNVAAVFVSALGNEAWVLRIPAAIFGFLTVWGVFLLTKEMLSESAGLLAAFFIATSFWHINFSRVAFRAIASPFFLVFALYFLLVAYRALREGRSCWLPAVAGGILYGLGFYTYIAYRVTPLLVGIIVIVCGLAARKQEWFLKWVAAAGIFILTAILVVTPLAVYFIQHPGDLLARSAQVSVFAASNPVGQTFENIWKTILMLYIDGDSNWRHNYAHSPQIYWPVALLMTAGIAVAIRDIFKRTEGRFLASLIAMSWLILASAPAFLSNEGVPHALRAILMIPPAMILAAIGTLAAWSALATSVPKGALVAAAIAFFLWLPYQAADKYFVRWARNPALSMAFETLWGNLADQINAVPRNMPSIVAITAAGVSDDRLSMPLVQMEMDDDLWHAVKATPRVTGFLGGGNVPTPLTADEVNQILYRQQTSAERPRPKLSFEKNETVRIIEGPFTNFQGKVDEVNAERGTLRVMVTIFGRSTPVELEFLQVEKTQ